MVRVFAIQPDGMSLPLKRVQCKNEDEELQSILERNPDLLPGDQIRPEDPRRWLMINREMPVPDPNTGQDRWNIDFLFVDQDALPTFVECKRFHDTRSRREVIGQVFEYAANGHYYWTKDLLRDFADKTAVQRGTTVDESLAALRPTEVETEDAFFQKIEDNLREGQLRIVFFLEDSPMELRSLVDFLNKQMERSEILIVEARLFERDGQRWVVPVLFGYSEESRRVKRMVTVSNETTRREKREWDEASMFADIQAKCDSHVLDAARKLYECWKSLPCEVRWRGGAKFGGCALILRAVSDVTWLGLGNNGDTSVTLGGTGVAGNERALAFRNRLMDAMKQIGFELPELYDNISHRNFKPDEWVPKLDDLMRISRELFSHTE